MVGENFEIYLPEMARIAFKLSSMVGEILKFTCLKWPELSLNYPPWLENFEIYLPEITRIITFNCPSWLKKMSKFTCIKWPDCLQIVYRTHWYCIKICNKIFEHSEKCWNTGKYRNNCQNTGKYRKFFRNCSITKNTGNTGGLGALKFI